MAGPGRSPVSITVSPLSLMFKRLPVAGTGQLSREIINGDAFAVSEIYLNG